MCRIFKGPAERRVIAAHASGILRHVLQIVSLEAETADGSVGLIRDQESCSSNSAKFAARLRSVAESDSSYWDYSSIKSNCNPQAYFQYPAMMVPRMQSEIILALIDTFPDTQRILDPFAGSGTVLTESLKHGLSSIAVDVNPMAILLCKVKAARFQPDKANEALRHVLARSACDVGEGIEIDYYNRHKWFSTPALKELSRVRRAIRELVDLDVRRLLWVAFAEAVRICSNSRTSTYKLHMRESADVERRELGVRKRVVDSLQRVVGMYVQNAVTLEQSNITKGGKYAGRAKIVRHDIRQPLKAVWADAMISSPPYGDNHTTVTYGQHSFLPLCWIPLDDIDEGIEGTVLENTHSIDSASLGGKFEHFDRKREDVRGRSPELSGLLDRPCLSSDAKKRLSVFFYDIDLAFSNCLSILKADSPIVLTLGNRCVGGERVPTDIIVRELLEQRGCHFIDTHSRAIPTKRMAHRNQTAGTMLTEKLLIMRSPLK